MGHFSKSQIISFPTVLIHFEPQTNDNLSMKDTIAEFTLSQTRPLFRGFTLSITDKEFNTPKLLSKVTTLVHVMENCLVEETDGWTNQRSYVPSCLHPRAPRSNWCPQAQKCTLHTDSLSHQPV